MRKGTNPAKLKDNKVENDCFHQIIVPVYLPKLKGYYAEGLEILKLCLESIYLTVHDRTYISVVNNGSCQEVKAYLDDLLGQDKIQEVIHTSAIGKINAILKALVGYNMPLITIADADVLFLNKWQTATYEVFENFPKTGVVCTTPSPKSFKYLSHNIFFDCFFTNNIKLKKVSDYQALVNFEHSIENPDFYSEFELKNILTVNKNNHIAVIGAGHFVATYRREIFSSLKKTFSEHSLGGGSDQIFLDLPGVNKGYWRLSTYNNHTYHMGNIKEDWMELELEKLTREETISPKLKKNKTESKFKSLFFNKLIHKLFNNKFILKTYLLRVGLSKEEVDNFFK